MRRILALVMTLVIGFSLGDCVSYAAESQTNNAPTIYCSTMISNNLISPERIVHSYSITIHKAYPKSTYPAPGNIPTSIYYEEYNSSYGTTFHGYLYIQSIVTYGNAWDVTYSGTLVGNI